MEKVCIVCGKPLRGCQRKFCSPTCKAYDFYQNHKNNSSFSQFLRCVKRKLELIEYKGGKCEICGYNKNIAALEFHHKDPSTKKFNIDGRKLANGKLEELIEEVDKCLLVCSVCHKEIHYEFHELEKLKQLISEHNVLKKEKEIFVCKGCGKILKWESKSGYCRVCYNKHCNRNKVNRPTKEELQNLLQTNSLNKIGKMYGVSHACIKKWGIQYGIIK